MKDHTEEIKQLEVVAYTVDGAPTCAVSFPAKKVCQFYCEIDFGTQELCSAVHDAEGNFAQLFRRNPDSWLIPDKRCPLWKQTVQTPEQ